MVDEFARSFYQADVLIVTSIYSAGEAPIENVTAEKLVQAIQAHGHRHVLYVPDTDEITNVLMEITQPDDIVITLGAGDISKVGREFLARLQAEN